MVDSGLYQQFLFLIRQNKYPWIASEYPAKWEEANRPIVIVWDESIQINGAVYWSDNLDIRYCDLQLELQSIINEEKNHPDEYPCGLIMELVIPVQSLRDLERLDIDLVQAKDIVVMLFYRDTLFQLRSVEGYNNEQQ